MFATIVTLSLQAFKNSIEEFNTSVHYYHIQSLFICLLPICMKPKTTILN